VKYFFPCFDAFKLYIGGGGCYSFLNIKDKSEYVHRHTHKDQWGGLLQAGLTYQFWECAYVSFFADYLFQTFDFHDSHFHSSHRGSDSFGGSGHIERHKLDMSGFKLGVGLGYNF
jgi:outer membrane protein W